MPDPRFTIIAIVALAGALASRAGGQPAPDAAGETPVASPGIEPEWTYHGIGRPVMVRVTSPQPFGAVTLVLMDAAGRPLLEPVEVRPGRVDLNAQLPAIKRLRRAAYLQAIVAGEPVGSSMVVQPMLSRLVPVAEPALSPSGFEYQRIVDWYDEGHPPAPEGAPEREADETLAAAPRPADLWLAPSGDDSRLCTGLRLWVERDVMLYTTEGAIRLALRPDAAPNTAWNFMRLCEGGFYRDIAFHRVVPYTRDGDPFVIQAGDPTATGDGGPGYWLPMERSLLPHDFGVISMARDSDPDSAGSQIFICLSRAGTARLDGSYCAFGETVRGADVIRAIASTELADVATGRPDEAPRILSAALVDAPPRTPGTGRPDRPVSAPDPEAPPAPPARVPR